VHVAGPEVLRHENCPLVPDAAARAPVEHIVKTYRYEDAKAESSWVLPADKDYHKQSAGIAHTRSAAFLKPFLNGPYFDLEAVWDEHCKYEFGERDVDKTMATMVAEPYVNHIPTLT
jgi:carboxymethylenebutenolidase